MTGAARSGVRAVPRAWSVALRVFSGAIVACGGWAAVLGGVGLAGHLLAHEGLQRLTPSSEPMTLGAALALVAGGVGLVASQLAAHRLAVVAGGVAAAVALVSLGQVAVAPGWVPPLAPAGAAGFLAAGVGLVLLRWERAAPARLGAGLLGTIALTVSGLVLLGLEGQLEVALAWGHRARIGVATAAGLGLLGAGLVTFAGSAAAGEDPRQVQARRLGLLLAAAGALASGLVWDGLVDHERVRTHARLEENATRLARELADRLDDHLGSFDRMAGRWVAARGLPRAQWEQDAGVYLELQPGFRSLSWLDAAGAVRWHVRRNGSTAAGSSSWHGELDDTLSAARAAGRVRASSRVVFGDGALGTLLVAPLHLVSGRFDGFLIGELELSSVLADVSREQERLGYRFTLDLDGQPVLADRAELEQGAGAAWSHHSGVQLAGRRWRVSSWPAPETLAAHSTILPDVALGAGLLLSLALALTGNFALREHDRSVEAEAAREALEREVDERRLMEQRLAAQAERLEQAAVALAQSNQDLEEFAYVAAHDLRSPLRAIHNLSQWIAEDLGDGLEGETKENVQLLQARVERMERLLDSLLQYSRAGRRAYAPEQVEPAQVVRRAWEQVPGAERFELVVGSMPPLFSPRAPIEQVFFNLLGNAVKHHDRDRGRVEVRATPVADAGSERHLAFTVHDDGPGIPPEFHKRVFGMFKTLRPRDKVEGSGIGLALIKRIVNRYGGTVSIESEGGRGTTIRFTWPREPLEGHGGSPA